MGSGLSNRSLNNPEKAAESTVHDMSRTPDNSLSNVIFGCIEKQSDSKTEVQCQRAVKNDSRDMLTAFIVNDMTKSDTISE